MRIQLDDDLRLTPQVKHRWQQWLRKEGVRAAMHLRSPEAILGRFDDLSPRQREQFLQIVEADIATVTRFGYLGRWHGRLTGGLEVADRRARERGWSGAQKLLQKVAARVRTSPSRTAARWHQWVQRTRYRLSRRPHLTSALAAAGVRPHVLANHWAHSMRVPPLYQGFQFDAERRVLWAMLVGLDLIHADDGWHFIEANLNPGLAFLRHSKQDPVVRGIFEFAAQHEMKRVAWIAARNVRIHDDILTRAFRESAAAGIPLAIYEDVRLARRRYPVPPEYDIRQTFYNPHITATDTLAVRSCSYSVGTDSILNDKALLTNALEDYRRSICEARFRVDPMTAEPRLSNAANELPNLVYKYPWLNKGAGVHFIRARDTDHAELVAREIDGTTGYTGGMFQTFVLPRQERSAEVRASCVRAFVLLSPLGSSFLGALDRIAGITLPTAVPFGLVKDPNPFLGSRRSGGRLVDMLPDDLQSCREATLAICDGISWAFRRRYTM